ncbi:unnamed protein product, partial [marine sediment metagenome]
EITVDEKHIKYVMELIREYAEKIILVSKQSEVEP